MRGAFTKTDITVCLSGGVARGASHIGVLQALLEKGFNIKGVSGASAGALVGLFFASGYSPKEMLSILKSINWFRVFNIGKGGILGFKKAREIIKYYIPYRNFEELPIYFSVCALDLFSGKTIYIDKKDVISATLGSCALPFIFEPVPFENMLLVDGGLMDNLPITPLKQTFPQLKTVCVDILPAVFINKNLGTINNFLRSTFLIARKSMEDQKHMCDIYLEPPIQHISVIDYKKFDELYNFGYETAMSKIKTDF